MEQIGAGATVGKFAFWHWQPTASAVPAQKVMKQMLKPFKPAEPRFEGLNTDVSEETGAVVLLDSAAYLECTVGNRLEVRNGMRSLCWNRLQDKALQLPRTLCCPHAVAA